MSADAPVCDETYAPFFFSFFFLFVVKTLDFVEYFRGHTLKGHELLRTRKSAPSFRTHWPTTQGVENRI